MRAGPVVIFFACVLVSGREATAQAIGSAVLLNQQSTQSVGDANRQPSQANRPATRETRQQSGQIHEVAEYDHEAAPRNFADCGCAKRPIFPVEAGYVAAGTQVTIASPSPDAVIYYTTDGWTPTEASMRYTGPITINAETRLQAFAEEPNKLPSVIVEANYSVSGPAAPKPKTAQAIDGILRKGTALRLVTGAEVSSETAQPGDPILLLLDVNLMAGDAIVARKGSRVKGIITKVDQAGQGGKPGVLTFQVQSFDVHGVIVPLSASVTLAAPDLAAQSQRIADPSQVHVAGPLPPGEEAQIAPGMPLIATVVADTALHP
ncbi:MAG TPA: chitobiase/beta-hexosaminidase C-terminal domain-containing protein [Terracidiphilus sp.]|nr:chitobiase/beta-hexosaminidase C-terminal domain-containing protein [Terracidiphilus sp.]